MKYTIKQISGLDDEEIKSVCNMLAADYDQLISPYLIYTDKNYLDYLSNSLNGSTDFLYAAIDTDKNNLLFGFALCKQIGGTIVLTNIIIKQEYRGHDIGQALLEFIEQEAEKRLYPDVFALDVFEHNTLALKWYLRLGMITTASKYWYNLMDFYNNDILNRSREFSSYNPVSIVKDQSGFNQVLCGSIQVGTLINDDTLIIRSMPEIESLIELRIYFKESLRFFGFITSAKHDFPLIDQSYHMEMPFGQLKKITVNKNQN